MREPEPDRSVVYWAAAHASHHLRTVLVGGFGLVLVPALAGAVLTPDVRLVHGALRSPSLGARLTDAGLAGLIGFGVVLLLAFAYALIVAPFQQRDMLRGQVLDLRERAGTVIPAGWNAIISGQPVSPGEWVPPGFDVTMGQGPIHDEYGNTASGSGSRVYGGTSNTALGGGQVGRPQWYRR